MLYFQVVILAATVMLVYYCEFTDTFSPAEQGFICRDPTLTKPDPGPEQNSRMPPIILYSVVSGLPVVLISGVEVVIFLFYYNSNHFYEQEKVVVVGDCCYVNPMVRRTVRFLGNVRPAQNIPTIVVFVVQYFKKRPVIPQSPSDSGTANTDEVSPEVNHNMETSDKSPGSITEVT
ncbi:phospholipid phosphatase-related protein type 5-like [Neolamprologus brichardi]|uniref:phospholipid phosphatase-related protein type 5-like n=1 Tax=Neolamprologus brichardi TaxID=32507 RepID=UPI0016437A42|nr:phospholipid phosphatase-related protein type 5-like [Neolamprologus brichardi]